MTKERAGQWQENTIGSQKSSQTLGKRINSLSRWKVSLLEMASKSGGGPAGRLSGGLLNAKGMWVWSCDANPEGPGMECSAVTVSACECQGEANLKLQGREKAARIEAGIWTESSLGSLTLAFQTYYL